MSAEFRPIARSAHDILVVDDDPVSRYTTVRLLRHAGFKVSEAATGAEGLRVASDGVSVVILDVHLPDMNGFELCRQLRARPGTARLPVLYLSAAFVTDDDKVRGLDSGADAYLTHPVEPSVLVASVQALVRTRIAEEAMRLSEAKFRAIYSQVPGGLGLLDMQGRFVDANPAMLRFLGRTFEEVAGRALAEFVPAERTATVAAWVQAEGPALAGNGRVEFALMSAAGDLVHLEWTMTRHVEPNVSLVVANDISHRAALERQRQELMERERVARAAAERISRMKDELIAVLSHELRTPLNAIMGWTHVLQMQLRGSSADTTRGLDAIERNGRAQARMISDILDMSRLNMGKMPLLLESVDPQQAVSAAVQTMQPAIDEHGQRVVLSFDVSHGPIRADASRLQQIVWNLVSNALKFSPKGGEVRVSLHDDPEGVTITIADKGQGIRPEFLPFLFDRFTQSDAGNTRRGGGLGLGLAIVKHLVEAHGGEISAKSEGQGKGTEFTIRLPRDPAQARPLASLPETAVDDVKEGEADRSLSGLHILVVDDDRDACAMLGIILSDRGASVTSAYSYEEAISQLERVTPDVLISDVGMPGKDGYDLLREVRRAEEHGGRHIPAIALTSFTRDQDERQALSAGFDLHCPKPLRPMKLVQAVRALVGGEGFRDSVR